MKYRVTILHSVVDVKPDPVTGLPRFVRMVLNNVPGDSLEAGMDDRVVRIGSSAADPLWALQFPYENALWIDTVPMSVFGPTQMKTLTGGAEVEDDDAPVEVLVEHTTDVSIPKHER